VPDDYLEMLEVKAAEFRAMLIPLETGKIRIGGPDEPLDRTQARILDLRRKIREIQAILESAKFRGPKGE